MFTLGYETLAKLTLLGLAAEGKPFTADALTNLIGFPDDDHTPNAKNNLIGTLFCCASRDGIIRPLGFTASRRPQRHGNLIRVWQGVNPE